jgi:argininosuccinate lyase
MSSKIPDESGPPPERVLEIGARIQEGPSECLIRTAFKKELADQAMLFGAMSEVDIAHTLALTENGAIPSESGRELLAALLELQERSAEFVPDPARGDLYTNRESWLAEHSTAAVWLGAGRARREATTSAFLIVLREGLLTLARMLARTGHAITSRALELRIALMPDYTYLQQAEPTTFGHYLLGFVYPLLRDLERIRGLYQRVNRSPAGCGSTNGSRLPQSRERIGGLLGFDGLVVHARDAMWQADIPIETASILTSILVNLNRLAEDLQIFATQEFGLVELDDGHCRASKVMPQKKNPIALSHVRGTASSMIGMLAASATLGRTPSGQPDNRLPLYGMIPRAVGDSIDTVELLGEVVSRLRFNEPRARAALEHGFALAADLAEALVRESGIDFRAAHRLVGALVRSRLNQGGLSRLTPEELQDAAREVIGLEVRASDETLRSALNPAVGVSARGEAGGAAPETVRAMILECDKSLSEADAWAEACRGRLEKARDTLFVTALRFSNGEDAKAQS